MLLTQFDPNISGWVPGGINSWKLVRSREITWLFSIMSPSQLKSIWDYDKSNKFRENHLTLSSTAHAPCYDKASSFLIHYDDVIMGVIVSLITSLTIVYSTFYSDADQRKHQSCASLAFVWGIHRRPVNSPHKWPVTRKMFPFDDVIMSMR